MATIVKRFLSSSNMGNGISVTATQGATYNTIHSTTSGTGIIDEVYLYCQNDFSQTIELTLEWGVSTSGQQIIVPVPARDGPSLVVPGLLLAGSAGCQTILAFVQGVQNGGLGSSPATSGSSLISVYGYVNRITQP